MSERAIDCIEKDSLPQSGGTFASGFETGTEKCQKCVAFFLTWDWYNVVWVSLIKALESYSFALNFAPLAVPILLDRAAIYMEMGKTDRAYTDYCQVLDEDKQNKEALLMRAYIYVLRRDYPAARIDYNRLLELDPQSYSGRLGLATLEQKEGKFRGIS